MYEIFFSYRLVDGAVHTAGDLAALSQQQGREGPSRTEHCSSTWRQVDQLGGCVDAWCFLRRVSVWDQVTVTRGLL